jgi:hypothetical protein
MLQTKNANTQRQETNGEETVKHQTENKDGRRYQKEEQAQRIAGAGRMATADMEQIVHSHMRDRKEKDNKEKDL